MSDRHPSIVIAKAIIGVFESHGVGGCDALTALDVAHNIVRQTPQFWEHETGQDVARFTPQLVASRNVPRPPARVPVPAFDGPPDPREGMGVIVWAMGAVAVIACLIAYLLFLLHVQAI